MKMKMRNPLGVLLSLGCLLDLVAQEDAPLDGVRDRIQDPEIAPVEIPTTAPGLSDIDRLFGDSSVVDDESVSDKNNEMSELENSLNAPLDQEIVLDASDLISVDYPSEEIKTVLRNVADLYMLNLVVPDTVQGSTSIKLRDVTWRQIYSVVLDPVGYTFVEDGSIIKIVSKDSLNFEPPTTEIFMINYADAASIASTVNNLVDPAKGGSVQIDKRSNALIVSERASQMESIREVITRLDKPTQQVLIETRFIEVTNRDVSDVGVNWAMLGGDGYKVSMNDYNVITEASEFAPGGYTETLESFNGLFGKGERSVAIEKAIFSGPELNWILTMLKEENQSKLVSNPTVVTLNNQEATINVGEEYPIPNYQYNEETGAFEVSGFEFKKIGVILKVTPSVNYNGLITLEVVPEVSSRTGTVNFGGAGNAQIPIISTRTASTRISLKSGYTMGIGGLMESTDIDSGSHVPVLGKIPGLKKLFSNEKKDKTKRNLLIFLTARILPSEESDFEDVFSQERMSDADIDPMALKNR